MHPFPEFPSKLIKWYEANKRDLPWRHTRNPYHIWLSEVILQQTRVQQGLPYYLKFVEAFPTVTALAEAEADVVLRLWQGLGYYSRARNMHATAKIVAEQYGGQFPATYAELIQLKGIGPYTAAAIASFAFGEKVAVVDGNVYRVLSRIFGLDDDIASPAGKKVFAQLADSLLPDHQSDTYNQAIMEFGAMHCKPANPDCLFCVFSANCQARATSRQQVLPVKSKKLKIKQRYFHYILVKFEGKFLMKKRPENDIWQGLYDFPLIEAEAFLETEELENQFHPLKSTMHPIGGEYKHQLTHQKLYVRFFEVLVSQQAEFDRWAAQLTCTPYDLGEIEELPKPILINNFLRDSVF